MHKSIMIVLSGPTSPEEEDAFNTWYSDVHLPEIVALPGVTSAARYKIVNLEQSSDPQSPVHQYVAIYELTAATEGELKSFVDNMNSSINAGAIDMSGPLDLVNVKGILALPIGRLLTSREP